MRGGTCRGCGAPIIWIKTSAGKSMPCDDTPIYYIQRANGTKKIVTPNGEVISCEYTINPHEATGIGYAPHWGSCPCAGKFKRGREKA